MAVLFVGNSINRYEKVSCSWDELLKNLFPEPTEDISKAYGNTMRYEYIDSNLKESGFELKKKIAQKLSRPAKKIRKKPESVHKTLMQLPFSSIITTNYDYSLEYSADPNFKPQYTTTEREYSFRRYQEAQGKRVYHIHGEVAYPASILLGFEHYAGTLEKLRSAIVKSTSKALGGEHKFVLYDVLNDLSPIGNEWFYSFFTEDVYFLGFGFDASEQDIWWLLSYRKRFEREHPGLAKNRLVYLDMHSCEEDSTVLRKMLKSFGVEVVPCYAESYDERYEKAMTFLKAVN